MNMKEQQMGSLLNRLGEFLKADKETPSDVPEGPSAMDVALQEAIRKRAVNGTVDDPADQPCVTITSEKGRNVFGRRGA